MYDAATTLLGLGDLAEGKTMGLASYGRALGAPYLVEHSLSEDGPGLLSGSPSGDADYAEHKNHWCQRLMDKFGEVTTGADLLDRDLVAVRIAASVQRTVEEVMRELHAETTCLSGTNQVCLAGGVALNSVANGRLPEPLFVPPFAHDAGVAAGAAWTLRPPSEQRRLMSPYLGTQLDSGYADLARHHGHRLTEFDPKRVAHLLASGLIGAIVEGRAEIGPRALGHRSIIARPHPSGMRDKVNLRKGRELWRPLAPVTTDQYADKLWPRNGARDLFMTGNTFVSELARAQMPAAVHVDGTTRPQRLPSSHAGVVSDILKAVEAGGDPPILINTSFNGPGEPIVDSAAHAISAYDRLGLDFLVLGDSLMERPRPI
jgi:carbamoyltransferase